jgi:hypothetical protein
MQWMISTYLTHQSLQDPLNKGLVIIPTSDPLHLHISKIKGLKSTKQSNLPIPSSSVELEPEPDLDRDEGDGQKQSSDGLYEMVGGVLVMPLNRQSSPSSKNLSHETEVSDSIQHTPCIWKPVSLPTTPAPPPKPKQPIHSRTKEEKVTVSVQTEDLHLTKEDLIYRIKNSLVPYHALILPTGEITVSAGSAPKIVIEGEMRAGNKVVTRMSGLEVIFISYGYHSS